MKSLGALVLTFYVYCIVAWGVNIYKFSQLDFQADWGAEIIRGAGIVTPLPLITAFIDIGEEKTNKGNK